MQALAERGLNVYAIDLLGQGKSWPTGVTGEDRLCYSVELWRDQLVGFVDDVIQRPVHIAGNSLGGYLAVSASSHRPDLVQSVALLNSAPFWGFAKGGGAGPEEQLFPFNLWNGTLPAPQSILRFGSAYFDVMRSPTTIKTMLQGVYKEPSAFNDSLVDRIIEAASQEGGFVAFTSILFSPKLGRSFDALLADLRQAGTPVCLVYGRDDPWIVPYWGQRAKSVLQEMGTYFELQGAGHCPHHESPETVNTILNSWVDTVESGLGLGLGLGAHRDGEQVSIHPSLKALANANPNPKPNPNLSMHPSLKALAGSYQEPRTQAKIQVELVDGQPRSLWEKVLFIFDRLRRSREE